jgi:hypothetical protein
MHDIPPIDKNTSSVCARGGGGGGRGVGSEIQKQNSMECFTQRMNMVMASWPSWNFIQCFFFFGGHKFKFFLNKKIEREIYFYF